MRLRRLLPLALLPVVAALVGACQDAYAPKALYAVDGDTMTVSALTGTPIQARSAVYLLALQQVVPGPSETFDFVLDLDANNDVRIIPRARVSTCTNGCQLGIQTLSTPYDSLYDAPSRGYKYDSTVTVHKGQTVAFVTKEYNCSQSNTGTYDLYGKMVVDSVRPSDRSIFIKVAADPNCGFRGLVPGTVPKH